MSSRSRPRPQPASLAPSLEGAAPELLVSEVPAMEAAGASRTEAGRQEATVTSLADAAQKRRPTPLASAAPAPAEESPHEAPSATRRGAAKKAPAPVGGGASKGKAAAEKVVPGPEVKVRRMHRRDLNRTW
ncbi:MAG TPA: hypothetical protein VGD74_01910, partial [Vulgatibacter sp.]